MSRGQKTTTKGTRRRKIHLSHITCAVVRYGLSEIERKLVGYLFAHYFLEVFSNKCMIKIVKLFSISQL